MIFERETIAFFPTDVFFRERYSSGALFWVCGPFGPRGSLDFGQMQRRGPADWFLYYSTRIQVGRCVQSIAGVASIAIGGNLLGVGMSRLSPIGRRNPASIIANSHRSARLFWRLICIGGVKGLYVPLDVAGVQLPSLCPLCRQRSGQPLGLGASLQFLSTDHRPRNNLRGLFYLLTFVFETARFFSHASHAGRSLLYSISLTAIGTGVFSLASFFQRISVNLRNSDVTSQRPIPDASAVRVGWLKWHCAALRPCCVLLSTSWGSPDHFNNSHAEKRSIQLSFWTFCLARNAQRAENTSQKIFSIAGILGP